VGALDAAEAREDVGLTLDEDVATLRGEKPDCPRSMVTTRRAR